MSAAKTSGYLLVLAAIGLTAFALFGAIHEARIGRPLRDPVQAPAGAEPAALMRAGAQGALTEAARLFHEGRRREAANAMDAGLRLLEVGAFAFGADGRKYWHQALQQAKKAKVALANGKSVATAERLRAAADTIGGAPVTSVGTTEASKAQYAGATLLNAAGIRIGEVVAVGGGDDQAKLAIGGVRDLFGFLDWGSRTVSVAAGQLVFGRSHWPEPTMVVLPTLATGPEAILRALPRAR